MQRGFLDHFLHLHHHDATVVVHRLSQHQRVEVHHLIFKRGIAFAVAGGGADKRDGRRNRFVVEIFFVINLHQFDEVFFGDLIELAPLLARVDEGANPDIAEDPRLVGGRRTQSLSQHPLWIVIGDNLVPLNPKCVATAPSARTEPISPGLPEPAG